MIKSYLKTAIRNLMKFRFISLINIFGLTIGLCCCLLISAFVLHELSYDRYYENASNIYRIERTFINPETGIPSLELGSAAPAIGPLLENDFKEIEKLTRIVSAGIVTLQHKDNIFNENNTYFADENFVQMFNINVIKGNPEHALFDPFSVMVTREIAQKYFPGEEALDKTLRLNNQLDLRISAIYEAFPGNSHMHPEILISLKTIEDEAINGEGYLSNNWSDNSYFTYILLPDGYNPENLQAQFPAFFNRHLGEDSGVKASDWTSLNLRPLKDIHLYSHTDLEAEVNGDIKRVYIFSAIALFILLIACINYMNLSTARSILRAKEIGIRKVIGARKKELVTQFLSESILISWLALLLALGLTWFTFPFLKELSGREISFDILLGWKVILPLLLLPFVVGILSGLYPALFLSSLQASKTLKGIGRVGKGGSGLRKSLVILQFSISIILIIGTVVVLQQLKYMQEKSLGFNKEQVITLPYNQSIANKFEAFNAQLKSSPFIKNLGRSSLIPSDRLLDAMSSMIKHGNSLAPTKADIKFVTVDENFFLTYGIKILAGRPFSSNFGRDTTSFIVNEAALGVLGVANAEEAIGKEFQYGNRKGQLIGVVKDFHFESLHQRILPLVFFKPLNESSYGNISIKLTGENLSEGLQHLEKTWLTFSPEIPFEYNFLDSTYASLYESEVRQGTVFTIFSCIAIAIACLGLFGLSAFTINQRLKEIGIRKVLGAETSTIVALLSKDFLKLVLLAAVIAFPVAWFAMDSWLQDFAYRIDISFWIFIASGIIAAGVAFLTISFQAVKAATSNPIKNLRTE